VGAVRDATFYASSLLELHNTTGAADKRASWRQSMAALARATTEEGPGPLEGLHPEALVLGVRAALHAGLVDDLDWLAPAAAGAALFELASALPPGPEQRELGRRVLARLMAADAETFVAIARRMAMSSPKALGSASVRARVALVVELPIGLGVADGPLALAIAARRESAREWIAEASTGSLPSRRLAARLLERAALEAARRASHGDDHSLRVFRSDSVAPAWRRLLADRESLVWRHVAVARGLLAPWDPAHAKAIEEALAPTLSPTEWRRAAASIAAHAAVAPAAGVALAKRALSGGLLDRDPGAASAFLWGLPRAAEAEPDAGREILDLVMDRARTEIGEAVIELRAELGESTLADRAAARARELHAQHTRTGDDGAEALAREVARDLGSEKREDEPLRDQITRALHAFASDGARQAQTLARDVLGAAQGALVALEAVTAEEEEARGASGAISRRTSLAVLRDLDVSLLERDVLAHLLALGGGEAARSANDALDPLRDRLGEWLLVRESEALDDGGAARPAEPAHPTLALRRLRALLHLVDGDIGDEDAEPHRAARLRKRWIRIARALLDRFERGPASVVRRTVVAALARAFDALVRVHACDVVDVLLVVARSVADPKELGTLAEASMDPDLVHVLQRYARFAGALGGTPAAALTAFDELTREIAPDASGRMEALRTVLVRLATALRAIASTNALYDLAPTGGEPEAIESLESALASLSTLVFGARGRFDPDWSQAGSPAGAAHPLTVAVARVLSGADPSLEPHAWGAMCEAAVSGLPTAIGRLVAAVVGRLPGLPLESSSQPSIASMHMSELLPPWLSTQRTIGGFYVLRSLGSGAGGSVFVVTRLEDKGDAAAGKLALKVPEYSASAARSLSEAEFLKMFRDEAGTLIALPQHQNLARFVTFDAGSKPKPILVMELVEGITLERMLETRSVDSTRAIRTLDDVLQGLEAMHAVGVAHLDLKPSNVVLRKSEEAVLVDFGLAGRHIRPGCATGPYGAPEVWGALDDLGPTPPPKADVYAFACVAFETLTGQPLFDADNELMQVALHVSHDGFPEPLKALARDPRLTQLTELLFSMLRRNPADRITAPVARKELERIAPTLTRLPWPLGAR
jgi:eukaryotic-like serine/threonine-protein kinase